MLFPEGLIRGAGLVGFINSQLGIGAKDGFVFGNWVMFTLGITWSYYVAVSDYN